MMLSVISVLWLSPSVSPAYAVTSVVERSELAKGRVVANYRLIDQDGRDLPFHSLRGRPVLVSFMYAACVDTCLLTNESIKNLLKAIDPKIAKQLLILSVSIDQEYDTSERLKEYGLSYTANFENWRFVKTDEETLKNMVRDLGFSYEKTKHGFDHLSRLTLIGPDGRVVRHFYGTDYNPGEVGEAVKTILSGQSLSNRISDTISRVLIYCSTYDAVSGTYRIDYSFIAATVINSLLVIGSTIFLLRKMNRPY